ncbi:MAG: phosphoribosylglycinamide formyltransferase [Myxococcales bacterium]|nr:phosphoribosylglycinamide formyltransferase [Myxococcales bacterium]
MTARVRAGVLVSGGGTNLQALIDACAAPGFPAEIAVVISNVAEAFALERARKAGIATAVIDHKAFPSRDEFEAALVARLREHRADLVCLAGFMRLLGGTFLRQFPSRVLNIHPALLPAFPGLHGPRQALDYGVKIAGCTVHLVDEGTDTGPVVAQAAVPVLADDDEAKLAARILAEEHRLYPLALRWVAEGRLTIEGRKARVEAPPVAEGLSLRNPGR